MRTRLIIVVIITALVGVGLSVLVVRSTSGLRLANMNRGSLRKLANDCWRKKDKDGFGQAKLGTLNLQNQTVSLNTPCKIYLQPGSYVQLTNVTLSTRNLFLTDLVPNDTSDGSNLKPSHLVITNSTFSGDGAGLQVSLRARGSSIVIKNSHLTYPLSIGFATGFGDDDKQSSIDVRDSHFRSLGDSSDGVTLVSAGGGVFIGNRFEFSDPEKTATLLGDPCTLRDNQHANERCRGP